MSKAKMEAARELIKEKKYDEARAILRTVDNQLVAEWIAKIDALSPPKQSRSMALPLAIGVLVIVLVLISAIFIFRGRGNTTQPVAQVVTVPSQTPTLAQTPTSTVVPTATYTPTATTCSYSKDDEGLVEQFLDTTQTATGISRISVGPEILELQKVSRQFEKSDHPSCMETVTSHIKSGMHFTIQALQDFSAQKDDVLVGSDIDLSSKEFAQANDECVSKKLFCPDYRLSNVKLFVWKQTS